MVGVCPHTKSDSSVAFMCDRKAKSHGQHTHTGKHEIWINYEWWWSTSKILVNLEMRLTRVPTGTPFTKIYNTHFSRFGGRNARTHVDKAHENIVPLRISHQNLLLYLFLLSQRGEGKVVINSVRSTSINTDRSVRKRNRIGPFHRTCSAHRYPNWIRYCSYDHLPRVEIYWFRLSSSNESRIDSRVIRIPSLPRSFSNFLRTRIKLKAKYV